jgi:WD40 repeat protein
MAQVQRHRRAIAVTLLGLAVLAFAPAFARDQTSKDGAELYDRPTLAIDPGMHTAAITSQAVDAAGRYAVTGSDDRTVRAWSLTDHKLVSTIWIPVGPENVGTIYAVAISPDGSTIAAGGWTQRRHGSHPIYLFDRESGNLIRRIGDDLPDVTLFLTFSRDGRYLAAMLGSGDGLRVFDRDDGWSEAFRDEQYGDESYGASFSRDGRLATTSFDGLIRLYRYDLTNQRPNFRRVGEPVKAPSGDKPFGAAFSPDGKRLAVGYDFVAAVDVLDGVTLKRLGGRKPGDGTADTAGLSNVAWSRDGRTLLTNAA